MSNFKFILLSNRPHSIISDTDLPSYKLGLNATNRHQGAWQINLSAQVSLKLKNLASPGAMFNKTTKAVSPANAVIAEGAMLSISLPKATLCGNIISRCDQTYDQGQKK